MTCLMSKALRITAEAVLLYSRGSRKWRVLKTIKCSCNDHISLATSR